MARIYSPREITKDGQATGLYHMTVHSDEEKWCIATGLCAAGCPGHATPAEALRHWQEGQLQKVKFDAIDEDTQRKCAICGAWTQKAGYIQGELFESFPLCDAHLDLESFKKLYLAEPKPAVPA